MITNEYMMEMLKKTKDYTIVLLKKGPSEDVPDIQQILWEHGRRNFELRAAGLLPIVCPVTEENDVRGIGIFNCSKEKAKELLDEDPGVKQGVFVYEMVNVKSFPGDALP